MCDVWHFNYPQGNLTFEKDATFVENHNVGSGYGEGGAISVHVKGSVHFMGNLNVTGNSNLVSTVDLTSGQMDTFRRSMDKLVGKKQTTLSGDEGVQPCALALGMLYAIRAYTGKGLLCIETKNRHFPAADMVSLGDLVVRCRQALRSRCTIIDDISQIHVLCSL